GRVAGACFVHIGSAEERACTAAGAPRTPHAASTAMTPAASRCPPRQGLRLILIILILAVLASWEPFLITLTPDLPAPLAGHPLVLPVDVYGSRAGFCSAKVQQPHRTA